MTSETDDAWDTTFEETAYVYGLEMIPLLALLLEKVEYFRGKNVTFYIDNQNAINELIKNDRERPCLLRRRRKLLFGTY